MLKVKDLILNSDDDVCSEQKCPLWKKCTSLNKESFLDLCEESEGNFLKIIREMCKHE